MIIKKQIKENTVLIYSSENKKIIRDQDKAEFSKAVQPLNSLFTYKEKK